MKKDTKFIVRIADDQDMKYVPEILQEIELSAKERGTGIAKRSASYVEEKIRERKAIVAFSEEGEWAGFCYIETWGNKEYVANSGLIVAHNFRKFGLAKKIKEKTFQYSRERFPEAKIFGLTTGLAVMKINSDLGYRPVTYSELTQDDVFWKGCQSCVNYEILKSKERKNCLCTGMLYDPKWEKEKATAAEQKIETKEQNIEEQKFFSKFKKIKKLLWKK